MTDSHLVRHLQAQTSRRVGLLPYTIVREGAAALRLEIDHLREQGVEIALVDVLSDADLLTTAEAVADLPLVTGGSGLGMALPEVWARSGLLDASVSPPGRSAGGNVLILSGSCSAATLAQLDEIEASRGRGIRMDVARLLADFDAEVERLYAEAAAGIRERGWALVASSAGPEERGAAGKDVSGVVEAAHRELATKVVGAGLVSHLVVAGGETSGAVTAALRLNALEIERVLDPGVPIMRSLDGGLTLTLKSGNFGSRDFFTRALNYLQGI